MEARSMSTIKVNTIQKTSGVEVYTINAWANVNQIGTTSIRDSRNVASVTDLGTGKTQVNWSNSAPNANYSAPCSAGDADPGAARIALVGDANSIFTTSVAVQVDNTGSTATDGDYLFVSAIWA
jgi:hypothetical protein